ncbi:MAG TPA: lipopolysaccharide biosynthesis protein [Actinocrinis sp.]|uniref:lipopolysaccharide biosynthesis protein n=1 Tax=Actinocrinis sp. TaxID=1920516 RepID=UPI002D6376CF|nr:lipopolysaccharide biosynthesis protein [Actinocrinis sp.]HZU55874.1 lipopolysaccharide biosynthesis protein [Actinocrinis sp.]
MSRHSRASLQITENSLFLMASTGVTAALGYCFWILVGREYSPERVGLATSLINTISLISYLSLFGFNSVLIRHQAAGRARNRQVTLSLLISGGGGWALGGAFLLLLPWISPKLLFIRENPWYALCFVAFCAFAAVNLLTDSVFMAARLPQYNLLVDGFVQSLSKLAMPIFLVSLGAAGIVASTGVGFAAAVLASLIAMWVRLGFRPDFGFGGTRLREHARYSLASYGSSLLNLLPQLVLPLLALQRLGSGAEAYYFMAFQIANMLYTVSHSIGDATFSEASHDISLLGECLKRSARLNVAVLIPAVVVVILGADLILGLFGQAYADHARGLLTLLAAGALAVALNNWSSNALRVVGRMRPFVVSNLFFAVVSIGMAAALASRGLLWVGAAWVCGNLICGLVALAYVPWGGAQSAASPAADGVDTREAESFGVFEDTVPLVLPWVTADTRRISGARAARSATTAQDTGAVATAVGTRPGTRLLLGGDMAVRPPIAVPSADERSGSSW